MASINVKLLLTSAGLLSQPLSISKIDSILATGVIASVAKLVTVTDGSGEVLFAKANFTDADDQVMVLVQNTGATYDLMIEAGTDVEFIKLKPGQFAMFPWYCDDSLGQDITVYASNATGTSVEATAIEIS